MYGIFTCVWLILMINVGSTKEASIKKSLSMGGGYPKIFSRLIQEAFFLPHIIQAENTTCRRSCGEFPPRDPGVKKHCFEPTPTWMVILRGDCKCGDFPMFNGNLFYLSYLRESQ